MEGMAVSNTVILNAKKKGRPKKKQLVDNLLLDNWNVQQIKEGEITNMLNLDSGITSHTQLFLEVGKGEITLLEKREPKVIVSKILDIKEAGNTEYGITKDETELLQKMEPRVTVNEDEAKEDIKCLDAQPVTGSKEESTEQLIGENHAVKQAAGSIEAMTVDENNGSEPPAKSGKQRKKRTYKRKDLTEVKDTFAFNNSSDILTSGRKKRGVRGKNSKVVKKMRIIQTNGSNEETKEKVEKEGNGNSGNDVMLGKSETVKKRKRRNTKAEGHEQIEQSAEIKTLKNERDVVDEEMQNFDEQVFVMKEDSSSLGIKKIKSAKLFNVKQKTDIQSKQSKRGRKVQKKRDNELKIDINELTISEGMMEELIFDDQKKKRKSYGGVNQKTAKTRKRKIIDAIAESENVTKKSRKMPIKNAQSKRPISAAVSQKFVGAHVSMAGGIYNAIYNAANMGAKSFALFLKSSRTWQSKPLDDDDAQKFKEACKEHGYLSHLILPHGSYLMNCGSPHRETLEKSRDALIDELQRCEKLGLTLYNFHPGSTCGKGTVEDCLDRIAESINIAHNQTKYVITVIENMSCQGSTVGGKFTELAGIIARVKDKSRIGVCLDTCHAYAAGYDLSTETGYNQMIGDFDRIIGFQYLKALHLNDSAGKLGCHLDRHENIGKGNIGKEGFKRVMNEPHFDNIPMILETPYTSDEIYSSEINLLESLCSK